MANNIIRRVWNQNRMVNIEDLTGAAFQAEIGGHTFEISGTDDTGAAVALSGTVSGVFRRPDNADIELAGTVSDGVVSVTLTEDCYAVPGRFGLVIFLTSNGKKVCVYACVGTVAQTYGGGVIGEAPQTVDDLIAAINAAIASIPPDYSALSSDVESIKAAFTGIDLFNILPLYGSFIDTSTPYNGVTWIWNDDHTKCTVNGTSTGVSFNNFLVSLNDLLFFKPGETYRFNVKSSVPASLSLHIFFVYNGTIDDQNILYLIRPTDVTIPSAATGIVLRVGCAAGVTFSNATIEVGIDNRLIPTLYPTGETNDRGNEILTRISKFGYCELAEGDFYLSKPITIPANSSIIGTSKKSRIIKSSHTNRGMFVVDSYSQNVTFRDITFVGTNTQKPSQDVSVGEIAISLFGYAGYVTVDNCAFYGLERAGIFAGSGGDWLRCLCITNSNFLFCGKGIEFAVNGEFSKISNCHFNSCYYGVSVVGGNNCFSCCGFDACYVGMLLYDDTTTPTNDGHGSCVASTFNHCDSYGIAAYNIDNGYVFDACQIFFGGVLVSNSTGILFSNCQLRGDSTPVNIADSTLVVMDCCIFALATAAFNVTNTTKFIKRNCYYLNGTDV